MHSEQLANVGSEFSLVHLLRQLWGTDADGDVRPVPTAVSAIRRWLWDHADYPGYIFTVLRVDYKMPKGQGQTNRKDTSNIGGQNG